MSTTTAGAAGADGSGPNAMSIVHTAAKIALRLRVTPAPHTDNVRRSLRAKVFFGLGSLVLFETRNHVRAARFLTIAAMEGSVSARAALGFLEEFFGTGGYAEYLIKFDSDSVMEDHRHHHHHHLKVRRDFDDEREFNNEDTKIAGLELGINPSHLVDLDDVHYTPQNWSLFHKLETALERKEQQCIAQYRARILQDQRRGTLDSNETSTQRRNMTLEDRARLDTTPAAEGNIVANQIPTCPIPTDPDFTSAEYLYFQAALKGCGLAQARLTFLKTHGRPGIVINHPVANHWKKECSSQGATAMTWMEQAANSGIPAAQFCVALSYYNGIAIDEDDSLAFYWCNKAAEAGHPGAQNVLGNLFIEGSGCEANPETGLSWYIRAAEQREAAAIYNIGTLFERGLGVTEDIPQAYQWYFRASNFGSINAKNVLGIFYEQGLGVEHHAPKAIYYYLAAALEGHPHAQYNLGRCYHDGFGAEKNDVQAFKWFRAAAAQNHALAQLSLAICFENGIGIKKPDMNEAIRCYELSSKNNCPEATRQLNRICSIRILPYARLLFSSKVNSNKRKLFDHFRDQIDSLANERLTLDDDDTSMESIESDMLPNDIETKKNITDLPREILEKILYYMYPASSMSDIQRKIIYGIADGMISESTPVVPIKMKTSNGTVVEFGIDGKCYKVGKIRSTRAVIKADQQQQQQSESNPKLTIRTSSKDTTGLQGVHQCNTSPSPSDMFHTEVLETPELIDLEILRQRTSERIKKRKNKEKLKGIKTLSPIDNSNMNLPAMVGNAARGGITFPSLNNNNNSLKPNDDDDDETHNLLMDQQFSSQPHSRTSTFDGIIDESEGHNLTASAEDDFDDVDDEDDLEDLCRLKLSKIGFTTRKAYLKQLGITDLDMSSKCDCPVVPIVVEDSDIAAFGGRIDRRVPLSLTSPVTITSPTSKYIDDTILSPEEEEDYENDDETTLIVGHDDDDDSATVLVRNSVSETLPILTENSAQSEEEEEAVEPINFFERQDNLIANAKKLNDQDQTREQNHEPIMGVSGSSSMESISKYDRTIDDDNDNNECIEGHSDDNTTNPVEVDSDEDIFNVMEETLASLREVAANFEKTTPKKGLNSQGTSKSALESTSSTSSSASNRKMYDNRRRSSSSTIMKRATIKLTIYRRQCKRIRHVIEALEEQRQKENRRSIRKTRALALKTGKKKSSPIQSSEEDKENIDPAEPTESHINQKPEANESILISREDIESDYEDIHNEYLLSPVA